MSENKIKLVCVVGPTASGKTALSIEIAKRFGGEIISADSMQLYKGIHIASAAPDESEKCGIEHHLIEILEIDESCSVADYIKMAEKKIYEIDAKGKLPVVVGGTGLYIDSLINGIRFISEETDLQLRERLTKEMQENGAEQMLQKLSEFDAETAARLHPNDTRRIIRAFEIYYSTGKTQTQANIESRGESPYDVLMIGLTCKKRENLYDRINRRVDIMLENGLLDEAETTLLNSAGGAVQAIGHKELHEFLRGEIPLEEAVENLKKVTRNYAKRQLTWFRRDQRINWFFTDETQDICSDVFNLVEKWSGKE